MATLPRRKKTLEDIAKEVLGGTNSSSQGSPVVKTKQESIKKPDKNTDTPTIKKATKLEKNRALEVAKKHDAKVTRENLNDPVFKDAVVTKTYESIPNYNVVERIADKSKSQKYDKKQSLLDAYIQAQNRSAQRLMEEKNISHNDLANAYVKSPSYDWIIGKKDYSTDVLDKYVFNKDKRDATLKSFEDKGVTSEQSDLLNEYYKRLTREQSIQNMSDFADNHEVLGTLASFPTKLAGNIHSTIGNTGAYLLGEPIDSDSVWNMAGNTTDAMRESASKDLGNVGQFAYNVGTSIGDMVPTLATSVATGGASAVPMLVSGVSVYGDSTREGADRGLNPKQIMATGTANAAAEAIFEGLPLKGLTNIATKSGKTATKSLVKELAEQMGREAFEEMGTETVNNIADVIINGDKSNFNLSKQAYMSMGMSEEEATRQTYADIAKNVAYSGAAGAVSGGIMGAGASAFSRFSGNNSVQTNPKNDLTQLDPLNALGLQDNTAEQSTSPVEVGESQQTTNVSPIKNNAVNEPLNANYNSQKIDGFDELNKSLDRLVGMYKGNENTQNLYSQMKAAVNEYVQTGNQDAIDMAVTLASDIDDTLVGHSYTRKGSGKNSAKSQNNRVTTTFSKGEFADTFMSYSRSLWDAARNRSKTTNDNVGHDSDVVERIASMREDGNQRKRSYNDTLINKTDAPQELKNEFINNPDMYTQLSNAETSAKADAILANNDIDSAIAQYHSMLDAKDPAAVPLGYNLSKQLSQAGRLDESVQLVRDMSKALTESGQFSQAAAITMLNNDPEAAKRYLVREIDTMNQKGKERYGKKWTDFELTESELQQFNDIKSGDTEGIKALYENVYNRLRKQYPSTMTEKFMEFRRMSMLLNVRTNVRNIVSNALVMPVRWTADRVSALGEGVYSLINPKYQRTQSINPVRSKQAKKLASDAFETVRTELLGDNKYEDAKGAVRDKQIFKGSKTAQMIDNITNGAVTKANAAMGKDINPSLMETARNFTYHLLEKGDDVFVRKNFESRMASYIEAQGITDLENIPADAYTLATQEAFKATFKDDSALANCLSTFRQMLNKAPGNFIGEAIMPFTKTPANLAMRGIDYSPAGVFKGVKTLKNAKSNADYAKGFTQLGQAATGTAAIALGYALAESGFLKGDLSDDKDEAQFQKQQGELAYSVKTPLGYFTYDWAQPASIPLILGVAIHDSLENDKGLASGLLQGTLAAVDSWLKLSPLQNLSDIFGGYGTPAKNVWGVLSTDLPLSFIPTQLGAAARIGDTTQRVTYDQNSDLNNLVNQAKAKIPGLSKTLPVAYDTWGNPIQRQDNIGEAAIANLVNPGQFGNENVTPIDAEISALYETTNDESVFPKKASWTENNVKLDSKQYSEFQKVMGENSYAMASAFINSPYYDSIDDELKVKAIGNMYSFANALAKEKVTGYDIEDSSYKKVYSIYNDKGAEGVATYYAINANKDGTKNADLINAVDSLDISNEDKGYYFTLLKGDLSKEATAAYEEGGYEAVYDLYKDKVQAEAEEEIPLVDKIASLRNNSQSGTTNSMVDKIAALRSNSQSADTDMIAKIAALRN